MESHEHEPMSDEQLSALLKKWEVGGVPADLEGRVFAERPGGLRRLSWVLIPATACALAFAGGISVWLMHPPKLQPSVYVVQTPTSPGVPDTLVVAETKPAPPPPSPVKNQHSGPRPGVRVDTDFFFGAPRPSSFDGKPAPEPQVQAPRNEAPLPASVYRVGPGISAPKVQDKKDPQYSEEARIAKLNGLVVVQLVVSEFGLVRDAKVLRPIGLGLDDQALEALSSWRFQPGTKDGTNVAVAANIEMNFRLLENRSPWTLTRALFNPPAGTMRPVLLQAPYPADIGLSASGNVDVSFDVDENGIPINFRTASSANPSLESEAIAIVSGWRFRPGTKDGKAVTVPATFRFTHAIPDSQSSGPGPIRVGGDVQAANLINKTVPVYPREAKQAHIQGVVSLAVRIGRDGRVTSVSLISGDPILAEAAIEAVRQWLYRPTLLNGNPVEVDTQVNVNFTLSN
jgi:TonB family protein